MVIGTKQLYSMDWFKEKNLMEKLIFDILNSWFPVDFPLNPMIINMLNPNFLVKIGHVSWHRTSQAKYCYSLAI